MQPGWHALPAEEHDAKKGGFKKTRWQHLISNQRSDNVAETFRETAPVAAELIGHRNARHHAHGEGHGEDLGPEPRKPVEVLALRATPEDQKRGDERRSPNRERRKDNVKADG